MPRSILIDNDTRRFQARINIMYCETFWCQLRGFTFRRHLDLNEGLLLVQKHDSRLDSSIHMLAVFTPLAVFWINSDRVVVHKILALPWRFAYISPKPARYVLELHPDRLDLLEIGHKVLFIDE